MEKAQTSYRLQSTASAFRGYVKLEVMDIPEDEDDIVSDEDEGSFNRKSLGQGSSNCRRAHHESFVLAVLLFALYMGLVFIPPTVQVVEPDLAGG